MIFYEGYNDIRYLPIITHFYITNQHTHTVYHTPSSQQYTPSTISDLGAVSRGGGSASRCTQAAVQVPRQLKYSRKKTKFTVYKYFI